MSSGIKHTRSSGSRELWLDYRYFNWTTGTLQQSLAENLCFRE